ncbi:uncharacterized protein LOC119386510 [Rhipicephalus sanguineus]|uniref:Secreted protein n=1 Tax=Rhipicephalus sanguineus TaxID=34632 RepID=A0A9D4T7M3_RHISA|nr:uncharacterized protein LOC119386510 [Rhipicephalus sanguineus]KAH7982503.1 hypothetical protein HPB52_005421 [Rhipicephalus sanguineus]
MAFWTILLAAVAVLLLSTDDSLAQMKGNICEMDEARITELLDCILSKSPKGTLELWENTKAMFGGKSPAQAVLSMCSASPGAGETLISEFTNQQTRADKPKFKKALKDCSS